ncbi:MAG: hypothetical protein JWM90_1546 [Thermoleophilia bacterium]|nr:hypothetical protein [Thermoleophilia bacterium]
MFALPHTRRLLATLALTLSLTALVALPQGASATMLVGVEANGELVNSNLSPAQQAAAFDKLQIQGARIVRANVQWRDIAAGCAGQSAVQLGDNANPCYSWSVIDNFVTEARNRNIQVVMSVSGAPQWLHGSNIPAFVGSTSAQWANMVAHYPAFMFAIATRYNRTSAIGTVRYWTIWNEPNSKTFWSPQFSPAQIKLAPTRYAILYGKAAPAVKRANSTAVVAPGPTGPNSTPWKPRTYIQLMQVLLPKYLPGRTIAQKRVYLGAWAHNPYVSIVPPTGNPRRGNRTFANPNSIGMAETPSLVRLLDSKPITRGLKIWATEFGYETNPPDKFFGVSYLNQARWLPESFDVLDRTGRVSIGIWYGMTDPTNLNDFQSGVYDATGKAKPSLGAFQRMISTNASVVRRGASVQVFAKANVDPLKTRIIYSANGRTWTLLPLRGRRADGSIRVNVRMVRKLYFAAWDGTTRGPARIVAVRN